MDTQQISALSRAMSRRSRTPPPCLPCHPHRHPAHPPFHRHRQPPRPSTNQLSLVAIGLVGAHPILAARRGQGSASRPLADRFPESETRIASALRELEAHGYLRRTRSRLAGGQIVTRTVSYNQPGAAPHRAASPQPPRPAPRLTRPPAAAAPAPAPEPVRGPGTPWEPTPTDAPAPQALRRETPAPEASPASAPSPVPPSTPNHVPPPTAPNPPPPPLPQPRKPTPELHRAASALLADLRRHAPPAVLSEDDIRFLAPGVATWLERDTGPDTIRRTLTTGLPTLRRPAKLLGHRLTALLPPPLPGAPDLAPLHRNVPLQNCEGCDRAFRAPEPGHCRDCRTSIPTGSHCLKRTA